MNNIKIASTYAMGTLMLGAAPVFPIFTVPGAIAVLGSSIAYCLDVAINNNDRFMWNTLGIVNKNGVYPKKLGTRLVGKNIANVYTIPAGLEFEDILKNKDKIENILHSNITLTKENFTFIITKIKNKYPNVLKRNFRASKRGCIFEIGEDMEGNIVKLDLSGTEMHTGVFGATGTGKSVLLNIIMTQIIINNFEVRVIDPKAVEFALYKEYSKLSMFAVKVEEAKEVLERTVKLMDTRYIKLAEAKCKSFKDYKGAGMEPVFLVCDEYNALMDDKECKKLLFALLSRARAANIIVFVCTQRPSADVLPGNIKCNLKNIISFQVETNVDSEVVTGQKGNYMASKELKRPGEGLLKIGSKFKFFKSYYLTDEEILHQISHKLTGQRSRIENTPRLTNTQDNKKDDIEAIRSLI